MQTTEARADVHVLQDRLGYLINQARNAVLSAVDDELSPFGVTSTQFIALMGIAHGNAHTPGELCRLLSCDSGAMTRLLDRIERKGLVRRVRDPEDRRSVRIVLTSKGGEIRPFLLEAAGRVHDRFSAGFSSDELRQFRDFLQRFSSGATSR